VRKTQRIEKVSFIRQCYCEVGKIDCRREKREKKGKEKRNHKPAGTTCWSWLQFFLHIRSAAGTKEVQEPVGEGLTKKQRKENQKNRRKYRAGGKDLKQTNTDQPSRFQRRCSFFASVPRSVFSSPRNMRFSVLCVALFK